MKVRPSRKSVSGLNNITDSPIAQLARALAWHARGHRFDPDILHEVNNYEL